MKYEIIKDLTDHTAADVALFSNGMKAHFWEDQDKWALQVPNDSVGDNLVTIFGYQGIDSIAEFVARWNDKVAAACKLVGISAQQWWTLTRALERD